MTTGVARPLAFAVAATALQVAAATAGPVDRASVGAALPQLRALADRAVAEGMTPGLAVLVVHEDEVVFLDGFGERAANGGEPVDADTVFQLASVSKPISSSVVAALVGDGTLDWDARIADLLPDFRLHDPYPSVEVTVRDVFNHRSGLPGSAGDDLEDMGYDREEVVRRLRHLPLISSFRAGYAYSNAGLTVGGLAAAAAAGGAWEDVAQDRLFDRLGMATASFRHADFAARTNRAALHVRLDGAWSPAVERNADVQAPAGGASASARDLAAWVRMQLAEGMLGDERIVDADALAETHVPLMHRGLKPVSHVPFFYGLGWSVEYGNHGLVWSHAGAFSAGARTLVTLYPEAELGVVVLANAFPTGAPEGVTESFADLVFDGASGPDWFGPWNALYEGLFAPAIAAAQATYAAPPTPPTQARPNAAYVGAYGNDYVGTVRVEDDGAGLTLVVGPGSGGERHALTHFDRDTFLYYPSPEMPTTPAPIVFALGPDGLATQATAPDLATGALAVMPRRRPD